MSEQPNDLSGYAVALSDDGSSLAIGAPSNNGEGGVRLGHVRLFSYDPELHWVQMGPDLEGEGNWDYFGSSVSLSSDGGVVAIGAVEALPGCIGLVTIQLFLCRDGSLSFIEINPRFGGGVPLSIAAGADFPLWIVRLMLGRDPQIDPDGWADGLMMLRFDEEIYIAADGSRYEKGESLEGEPQ